MAADQLEYVIKFADTCCVGVSRAGEYQPCGKTAVAVASGDGEWEGEWWPVCAHHSRGRSMVPLADLLAAALARGEEIGARAAGGRDYRGAVRTGSVL